MALYSEQEMPPTALYRRVWVHVSLKMRCTSVFVQSQEEIAVHPFNCRKG